MSAFADRHPVGNHATLVAVAAAIVWLLTASLVTTLLITVPVTIAAAAMTCAPGGHGDYDEPRPVR